MIRALFARLTRGFPFAFAPKVEPTIAELRKALGTNTDTQPKRTQEPNPMKLRIYPRMRVLRKRA
jgi:hypothetical protein